MQRLLSLALLAALGACAEGDYVDEGMEPGREDVVDDSPKADDGADASATELDADASRVDAEATPVPCSDGAINSVDPISGRCYMYFPQAVGWATAQARCQALGVPAELATIAAADENERVRGLAPAGVSFLWLGGNDLAVEGSFVWPPASPLLYTRWRAGEPNNGLGQVAGGEDCMVIEIALGGSWDDRSCGLGYPYVCER